MDIVIFTGRVRPDEFRAEHPREYQRLVESGEQARHLIGPPSRWLAVSARIAGFAFLSIGLGIIGAIIYSIFSGVNDSRRVRSMNPDPGGMP